ncbi:MAG: hypothetical protein E7586_05615 [Ruminococcaceae bacterium]|nr:hypothetical protein [Oscillospiraceae bacterium]
MKKIGVTLLVLVMLCSLCMPCLSVSSAEDAVQISISFDGDAKAGSEMKLRIKVGKPSQQLAGVEFALDFNPKMVTPTITKNDKDGTEMAKLVTKMPTGWEQFCSYSEAESRYYFKFVMPVDGNYLTKDGQIVIDVPFKVVSAGVISFKIPNSEVIAIAGDDSFSVLSGKGSNLSVTAAGKGESFSVDLSDNGAAKENGIYYVNINVTNIGDDSGIIALEFALKYNPDYFMPYITEGRQMDSFMVSTPSNSWEQMCTLYESENKYILRFAALHAESADESEKLTLGKSIKISVPFKTVGKEGETSNFVANSATAIGFNNKIEKVTGAGSLKSVSIGERVSFVPQWIYESNEDYVFAPANTKISDFTKPLGSAYVTYNGKKITSGNVKTGYKLVNGSETLTVVIRGDVDCNGMINSLDYGLVKRACFGEYPLRNELFQAAAVFDGKKITALDYAIIKRQYFGAYNLRVS